MPASRTVQLFCICSGCIGVENHLLLFPASWAVSLFEHLAGVFYIKHVFI